MQELIDGNTVTTMSHLGELVFEYPQWIDQVYSTSAL